MGATDRATKTFTFATEFFILIARISTALDLFEVSALMGWYLFLFLKLFIAFLCTKVIFYISEYEKIDLAK